MNRYVFIHENMVCEMAAISSQPQCVKRWGVIHWVNSLCYMGNLSLFMRNYNMVVYKIFISWYELMFFIINNSNQRYHATQPVTFFYVLFYSIPKKLKNNIFLRQCFETGRKQICSPCRYRSPILCWRHPIMQFEETANETTVFDMQYREWT